MSDSCPPPVARRRASASATSVCGNLPRPSPRNPLPRPLAGNLPRPLPAQIKAKFPDNFRVDYALSREQKNKDGGKMYIQDKVAEYSDEIFTRMDNGAHMYFCGLKGMMPGITEMLESVSSSKGLVWEEKLKEWKKAGQWHVEVY